MKLIIIIAIFLSIGTFTYIRLKPNIVSKREENKSHVENSSYWTCSMHPQIHSEKPGECPICHMQLIKVKVQKNKKINNHANGQSRSEVHASSEQIELMGIQSHTVEKMTLVVRIPISGRMITSNSVAFQIYESDLRYIKTGLHFLGSTALSPNEEIEGIITSVDNIVDANSRTIRVIGSVKNSKQNLASESSFRGEIKIELKDRVAIPESSVLHTGSGDLVYLMDNKGVFKAKKIVLGPKTESYYEVTSGLNAGDTISSGPNFLIDSEAKIRGAN